MTHGFMVTRAGAEEEKVRSSGVGWRWIGQLRDEMGQLRDGMGKGVSMTPGGDV